MNSYRLEGSRGDDAMKKLCVAYFSSKNDAVSVHRSASGLAVVLGLPVDVELHPHTE